MPHLTTGSLPSRWGTRAVAPIIGNNETSGGCYDGNGEALWAAPDPTDGGAIKVYRTRDGWASLLVMDGTVDYLSTIVGGTWTRRSVALTRLNGTVYATVCGRRTNDLRGGWWIYRDTSVDSNGAGPWVLHGTIQDIAVNATNQSNNCASLAAEIADLGGGVWVTVGTVAGNYLDADGFGIAVSTDAGVTWTMKVQDFGYASVYTYGCARNLGKLSGYWVAGDSGNFRGVTTWVSPNGIDWSIATDIPDTPGLLASTPQKAWRPEVGAGVGALAVSLIQSTTDIGYPAGSAQTWVTETDTAGVIDTTIQRQKWPILFSPGPPESPRWSYTSAGRILCPVSTGAPPCRLYPAVTPGTSGSARIYPPDPSRQAGRRQIGYY